MSTKLTPLNPPIHQSSGPIQAVTPIQPDQAQVNIRLVEEVLDFDFPQAKKAWQALEEAGIDPGELVANGLNLGHGYPIQTELQNASFLNNSDEQLISESKLSDQLLMGYSVSTPTFPQKGSLKFLPSSSSQSLVKSTDPTTEMDIVEESQTQELKIIDFTAISKSKLNKLNPPVSPDTKLIK